MTHHQCTCQPDPECPEHGLDRGLNVDIRPVREAGPCHFCDRDHQRVYVVKSNHTGASSRFCQSCWLELVMELPLARELRLKEIAA